MRKDSGYLSVRTNGFEVNGEVYTVESEKEVIRNKNPKVYKNIYAIFRDKDKTVVSKIYSYSRVGGDFPTILGHSTSYGCPSSEERKERGDLIYRVVGGAL